MIFGDFIKQARKNKGLSQYELAEKLEVTQSCISSMEKGIRRPSLELLQSLSKALDVPYLKFRLEAGFITQEEYEKLTEDDVIETKKITKNYLNSSEKDDLVMFDRLIQIIDDRILKGWGSRGNLTNKEIHMLTQSIKYALNTYDSIIKRMEPRTIQQLLRSAEHTCVFCLPDTQAIAKQKEYMESVKGESIAVSHEAISMLAAKSLSYCSEHCCQDRDSECPEKCELKNIYDDLELPFFDENDPVCPYRVMPPKYNIINTITKEEFGVDTIEEIEKKIGDIFENSKEHIDLSCIVVNGVYILDMAGLYKETEDMSFKDMVKRTRKILVDMDNEETEKTLREV